MTFLQGAFRRPRRARAAGRHRRRRRGRPASCSAATRPDPPTFIGKGKAEELRELCRRGRRRHRGVRRRAHARPAAQPGEDPRPHGHRPHRRDPRHLRPERPHATRARPRSSWRSAALPAAAPAAARASALQPAGAAASAPAAGPGETQLEVDRRRLAAAHHTSSRHELQRARPHTAAPQRKAAARSRPRARSSIVGYTNAGKSTLLNRLTDAGVLVEDRLFATLDPTTRRLRFPAARRCC